MLNSEEIRNFPLRDLERENPSRRRSWMVCYRYSDRFRQSLLTTVAVLRDLQTNYDMLLLLLHVLGSSVVCWSNFYLSNIPIINPASIYAIFVSSIQLLLRQNSFNRSGFLLDKLLHSKEFSRQSSFYLGRVLFINPVFV